MIHVLTLLLTFAATAATAPPDLDKGMQIHVERDIDAPAGRAWEVLGEDFVGIDRWVLDFDSRALTAGEVPHGIAPHPDAPVFGRLIRIDGKPDQIQVLTEFDPAARSFTFRAGNPPKVLAYAHNRHTVVDLGDGRSRVDIDVVLVPKGIAKLLKGKIEKKYTAYMEAYLDDAEAGITGATVAEAGAR